MPSGKVFIKTILNDTPFYKNKRSTKIYLKVLLVFYSKTELLALVWIGCKAILKWSRKWFYLFHWVFPLQSWWKVERNFKTSPQKNLKISRLSFLGKLNDQVVSFYLNLRQTYTRKRFFFLPCFRRETRFAFELYFHTAIGLKIHLERIRNLLPNQHIFIIAK